MWCVIKRNELLRFRFPQASSVENFSSVFVWFAKFLILTLETVAKFILSCFNSICNLYNPCKLITRINSLRESTGILIRFRDKTKLLALISAV